jgi:Ion transport protein
MGLFRRQYPQSTRFIRTSLYLIFSFLSFFLYLVIIIIVFYFINVETSLELRFPVTDPYSNVTASATSNSTEDPFANTTDTTRRLQSSSSSTGSPETDADADYTIAFFWLLPLYAGCGYFALREFIQIVSLLSLKVFKLWLHDPSNYLNVLFIGVVLTWTFIMQQGSFENHAFRIGATISVTVLWVKLMAYLRNMLIDFAVFVGGVFYVVRRLAAFLISLSIILVAFSQMFYTIFQQTDYCKNQPYDTEGYHQELEETRCDANDMRPYCHFWNSFLSVYTMLLGEVDEDDFSSSAVATALFIIFMFLCVILLANVLIAIVKDSYKIIQDQKAAIVFWTNRLDFVAEMDAIANGPWKARFYKSLGCGDRSEWRNVSSRQQTTFGKELWKQVMDLFEDEIDDSIFSVEFLTYTFLRVMAAVFIIPLWLILGAFTVGWLWPPQVREAVFTSTVLAHSSESEKEDELRITQVAKLQQEVIVLREELLQELAMHRTQVVHMKSQLAERKTEIANEMKHIKRLVTLLFERQSYA